MLLIQHQLLSNVYYFFDNWSKTDFPPAAPAALTAPAAPTTAFPISPVPRTPALCNPEKTPVVAPP